MNIALICLYDNWAIGLRNLAHALIRAGFNPSIVHFKAPSQSVLDDFQRHPLNYENVHSDSCSSSFEVTTYNIDANPWTENEMGLLGDVLRSVNPEVIGFSARSVYAKYLPDFACEMSKIEGAITVSGGYDAILTPERHLEFFDYVCLGEGEQAMVDLARMVKGEKAREDIPNLCWKENGEMKRNPLVCPSCEHDFFYHDKYPEIEHYVIEDNSIFRTNDFLSYLQERSGLAREYYTFAGRGCVNRCAFCAVPKMYDVYSRDGVRLKKRTMRPIETIRAELTLAKEYGFDTVYIMDSFFIANSEYLKQFFAVTRELGLHFFAQFHPEQMLTFPKLYETAVESGLSHTVIGIQSGSSEVSAEVFNRPQDYSKILEYARMITQSGVRLDYHIITHNPFETEKDFELALDFVAKLPKNNAQIVLQRLAPFKGTAVHDMYVDHDLPMTINDEMYHRWFIILLFRYLLPDDLFQDFHDEAREVGYQELRTALYPKYIVFGRVNSLLLSRDFQLNGELDQALGHAEKVFESDADQRIAHCARGWIHYHRNEFDQAIHHFNEFLTLEASVPRHYYHEVYRGLGWTLHGEGRNSAALDAFSKACTLLDSDTDSNAVRENLIAGISSSYTAVEGERSSLSSRIVNKLRRLVWLGRK